MGAWMLAGIRRNPGPLTGTLVAVMTAATLTVTAVSILGAQTAATAGRLADASVVVAGDTQLSIRTGHGENAEIATVPLPAYRGVPATLAQRLAQVPGVASARAESGFPGGVVRPGDADVIAVTAQPQTPPDVLAQRIKSALHGGHGYTIATGAARGDLANPTAATQRVNGRVLAASVAPAVMMIALFVLAGTTALAVNLRRRRFALLRAVGATRGQVRRAILGRTRPAGAGRRRAGLAAWRRPRCRRHPRARRASVAARRLHRVAQPMAAADRVRLQRDRDRAQRVGGGPPRGPHRPRSGAARGTHRPEVAAPGPGAARSRRGGRRWCADDRHVQPERAGRPARAGVPAPAGIHGDRGLARAAPGGFRRLAGQAAAGRWRNVSPARPGRDRRSAAAHRLGGHPGGAGGRHDRQRLLRGPDGRARRRRPGIRQRDRYERAFRGWPHHWHVAADPSRAGLRAAAGIAPVSVAAADPDLEQINGEAVAGPLGTVLDLGVTSGSLATLQRGQIAVSTTEASSGALGAHVGTRVTVYLPDGTPYPATVSAIYSRSLAAGDLLLPAAAVAGHSGAVPGFSQILVSGGSARDLAAIAASHPGIHVASRQVYNAQAAQASAQDSFANNLILAVIAVLAAVSLVNTLVVATVERRRLLRLLGRVGATRGQLAAMFGWNALFVSLTGVCAGIAAGAVTLAGVSKALTGSRMPYVPPGSAAAIVTVVAALTAAAVLIPFRVMAHREPALSR